MPLQVAALWQASIFLTDSVTKIESCAFTGCSSLTSITLPDSVTEIGSSPFEGCSSLASITIPGWKNWRAEIGFCAFAGCRSLASITIRDSLTDFESNALTRYSSLIQNSLVSRFLIWRLRFCPFERCRSLEASR